ncbi:MAG: 3-deoxy-7-phosphoheptulonate synthase [Verrucomicrobia bacterium]|nr:3-deoxy-7-phosphoheptulonate synthase [Verrucomicrobiota bacterium]
MIIVMKHGATQEQLDHVFERITTLGLRYQAIYGEERVVIGVIGEEDVVRTLPLDAMPGVERSFPILHEFRLADREWHEAPSKITINGVVVGGKKLVVMAGPCTIENEAMLVKTAEAVRQAGALVLRGGAFKPRTSPYTFQGHGEAALEYLIEARSITGLPVVTEVMDTAEIELVARYADVLQIGARNMANFSLLKKVGKLDKPILLKRGMASTVRELLMSAEYILSNGNMNVILCERGIRTFEDGTRNTLDLSAVPAIKQMSHLPVIVDPSHGTGRSALVGPMAKAAIAAGADGLMIEVHPNPEEAISDGAQTLSFEQFEQLMRELRPIAEAVGREI